MRRSSGARWQKHLTWAFWLGTAIVAVWAFFASRAGGLEAPDFATVFLAPVAVGALAIAFQARRDSSRAEPLPAALESLATRIRQQSASADHSVWSDTFPISIGWEQEEGGLTEDLPALRQRALSRPGAGTVAEFQSIAGAGTELATVLLDRVPTKRLVILGGVGAGKTVLLARLMEALLHRRDPGGPVPVRLPLNRWDSSTMSLEEWMASRLVQEEPTLAYPAPMPFTGKNRAQALVETRQIIPLLDSFDELSAAARKQAIQQINGLGWSNCPLVLTGRTAEYAETVRAAGEESRLLAGAAGVVIKPVDPDQAEAYLRQKGGEWDALVAELGTGSPVGLALKTPLALFLCRAVCEGPSPTSAGVELCDRTLFPDEAAVRKHLFDSFVPTVYRSGAGGSSGPFCDADQAERYLRFLARQHRNFRAGAGTELSWWTMHHIPAHMRRRISWALAVIGGLCTFSTWPSSAPLALTTFFALLIGGMAKAYLFTRPMLRTPSSGLRWRWRWIPAGVGALMGIGMVDMQMQKGEIPMTLGPYLTFTALFSLVGGAAFGWRPREADLHRPLTPRSLVQQDRRTFIGLVATWAGSVTAVFALFLTLLLAYAIPVPDGVRLVDLAPPVLTVLAYAGCVGLLVGLIMGFKDTAWGVYTVSRICYALLGRVPFRLMAFLDDAHRLGVLRQSGASYELRHVELERHLAG
ncbi:NACHT domain-containing protein [Streptomyces rubiginosohelvolus]|uniref:NACHT domain-containing protein n=1 Tax=Streptomyces rubiginosohelvolus TaxID=67362 RepID=UPI0037B4C807